MFDRKKEDIIPLKYKVGDKIMGYHSSIGCHVLVGGTVVEVEQSGSYLNENRYKVTLEPELCDGEKVKEVTWWIDENEVQLFKQDLWDRAVNHWKTHGELNRKSYLEFIRMHRALRGENDHISDAQLEKELEERQRVKVE